MRITGVCLLAILACSCCQRNASDLGNPDTGQKRCAKIGQMMKSYYKSKYEFEIGGPLTFPDLESMLRKGYENGREVRLRVYDHVEPFEDSGPGKALARFKERWRVGDELYFFTSDEASWRDLAGIGGYVLIRENRMVDLMVTRWN